MTCGPANGAEEGRTVNSPVTRRRPDRRRLRSHLVNADVRLRLVLDDVIFALVAALLAIGILYYVSNREIGDSLYSAHVSLRQTRDLLTNGVKIAGIVTFVAVLLFGTWSLVDAHRIAGPMHRLQRVLEAIASGDLTQDVRFRRGDEFQEVAAALDRAVGNYADRLRGARSEAAAIRMALDSPAVGGARAAELRERADRLLEQLGYFTLPGDGSEDDGTERRG